MQIEQYQLLDPGRTTVKTINLGVVVFGRNEEKGISKCLLSVLRQTIKPKKICFVNDGSTDKTREIAKCYKDVEVMDFPEKHDTWLDTKNLARVCNLGVYKIGLKQNIDYILIMGGDTEIPENYCEFIISKMLKHPEIVVASGLIEGEYSHLPRGSARIVNRKYWQKIGLGYPVNVGYEGYLLYKASSMGLVYRTFKNINARVSKKTGSNYTINHWKADGRAAKALGYNKFYVLLKAIMLIKKNPASSIAFLTSYITFNGQLYEKELRDRTSEIQKHLIIYRKKEILSRFLRR